MMESFLLLLLQEPVANTSTYSHVGVMNNLESALLLVHLRPRCLLTAYAQVWEIEAPSPSNVGHAGSIEIPTSENPSKVTNGTSFP